MSATSPDLRRAPILRLADGILLLAPAGSTVLNPAAYSASSRATVARYLAACTGRYEVLRWLRGQWGYLGLAGQVGRLTGQQLVSRVIEAIGRRRVNGLFLPAALDPMDRLANAELPRGAPVAVRVPPPDVGAWSHTERVGAALQRVPKHLGGKILIAFKQLISPESLAFTVGAIAALAIAHGFGVGEIVDAGLAVVAYSVAGLTGLRALYTLASASIDAANATSEADLDAAAERLAHAITNLGEAFLTVLIARYARKANQSRLAASKAPRETTALTADRPSSGQVTSAPRPTQQARGASPAAARPSTPAPAAPKLLPAQQAV